jgi:hypothetical protein
MPDMLICCDGYATAAVKNTFNHFLCSRIQHHTVFYNVFNALCEHGPLHSAHVLSERAHQEHLGEQENVLEMVKFSHTTADYNISLLSTVLKLYNETALRRKPFGIGHMYTYTFLLRMADTVTSQNTNLSYWDTA